MRRYKWITVALSASLAIAQDVNRLAPIPTTGEPYTSRRVVTSYQKLADGTEIQHESESYLARDSQGRTFHKWKLPSDPLQPNKGERFEVMIYDPDTRAEVSWCTCGKTAIVKLFGEPKPARQDRKSALEGLDVHLGPTPQERLKYHSEDLAPQIIMGVLTRGSKAVRTLPAGADGNSKELKITIQLATSSVQQILDKLQRLSVDTA